MALRMNAPYGDYPVFANVTATTTVTTIASLLATAGTPVPTGVKEVVQVIASAAASFYVTGATGDESDALTEKVLPYGDLTQMSLRGSGTVSLELACRQGGNAPDGETPW